MKFKKNEAGFGLIEVMVASGILALITFAVVELTNTSLRGQKSVEKTTEIVATNEEIRATLSNPTACLNTFGGLNPASVLQLPAILDYNGNKVFSAGASYNRNDLTIVSMNLGPFQSPSTTIATLTINYTKNNNGNTSTGPVNLTRTINLSIALNGSGAIISCVALSKMSDGIWNLVPGTNWNINYSGGVVLIGNNPGISGGLLSVYNANGQGAMGIGGIGDPDPTNGGIATYSAIYLQGDNKTTHYGWVVAHHATSSFLPVDSFSLGDYTTAPNGSDLGETTPFVMRSSGDATCPNCLGILAPKPNYNLEVLGSASAPGAFHVGGTGDFKVDTQGKVTFDSNTSQFIVNSPSATLSAGTTTTFNGATTFNAAVTFTAAVTGTTFTGNTFTTPSDRNLKTDIKPLEVEDKALAALEPYRFVMKSDKNKKPMLGFIAQEVKKYFPEAVEEGKDHYLTVNYPMLLAPVVSFLKKFEAQLFKTNAQVSELQKKVEILMKQNEALTKRIEKLESSK